MSLDCADRHKESVKKMVITQVPSPDQPCQLVRRAGLCRVPGLRSAIGFCTNSALGLAGHCAVRECDAPVQLSQCQEGPDTDYRETRQVPACDYHPLAARQFSHQQASVGRVEMIQDRNPSPYCEPEPGVAH